MKGGFALIGFVITTSVAPLYCQGTVIYSSLGPGGTYNINDAATAGGPNSAGGLFSSGFSFVPAATQTLDSIQLPMGRISGTDSISLSLQASDVSGLPGTVLETFTINSQMGPFGFANPLISLTSVARPELQAGKTYWLVAAGEGDAEAAWNVNNLGLHGPFYSIQGGRTVLLQEQLISAYEIIGVPEPGSTSLFAVGFGALIFQFHRRRLLRA
jgi:hypothetical protein